MRAAVALFMSWATFCLGAVTYVAGAALWLSVPNAALVFEAAWAFLAILFLFLAIVWAIADARL